MMALNILPIISIIKNSSAIAGTINSLIKQFNKLKENGIDENEFREAIEIQSTLNERFEKQAMLLESAIVNLQKSIKAVMWLAVAAIALSLTAFAVSVF
jgi:hypothetical protein